MAGISCDWNKTSPGCLSGQMFYRHFSIFHLCTELFMEIITFSPHNWLLSQWLHLLSEKKVKSKDTGCKILPYYKMLPVSAMNLSVVLSFLLATTPLLLFHIPLSILLIQLYPLPSIQPLLFFPLSCLSNPPPPPSSSVSNYSSEDPSSPQSFFCFSCLSSLLLFVSHTEYLGAVKMALLYVRQTLFV